MSPFVPLPLNVFGIAREDYHFFYFDYFFFFDNKL